MSGLLVSLVLAAGNPFLAEALEHEKNLDFEKCIQRLKQAGTQWKNTPEENREIELHSGLCYFNLGDKKAAAEHFRVALRIDEKTDLPPYTSPKVVEFFLGVKKSLQPEPPPLPDADLPDDRPRDPKLTPTTTVSPLGLTLQHKAPAIALGVGAVGAGVAALLLGLRAQEVARQANAAQFESDFHRFADDARGLATGSTITWVLAGASAIGTFIVWWVIGEPPAPAP